MTRDREDTDARRTKHIVMRPGENIVEAIERAVNEDAAAEIDREYLRYLAYTRLRTIFLILLAVILVLSVAAGALWRWYGGGWLGTIGAGFVLFFTGFFLLGKFLGEDIDAMPR